jgi:tRNA/rRNA methyltransferase
MCPPCHVVLVRPQTASNLGAVARAMRNFGQSRLILVRPEADVADPRAHLLATHSRDILDQAVIVDDLGAALADCGLVAATSCRTGGLFRPQAVGTPDEILPRLQVDTGRPAALVFGPEDHGLTNEEIAHCHYAIQIPTAPEHPSLNLAQAVAVCLYEWQRSGPAPTESAAMAESIASHGEQELMFARLREALERIHFLYGPKADALMHALRHLIGRARPSEQEVKLLLGLARQISWFHAHTAETRP